MTSTIMIIEGVEPKTYTLGYFIKVGKKRQHFRDPRFGPKLTWFEAVWLLRNEEGAKEVAKRNPGQGERFFR